VTHGRYVVVNERIPLHTTWHCFYNAKLRVRQTQFVIKMCQTDLEYSATSVMPCCVSGHIRSKVTRKCYGKAVVFSTGQYPNRYGYAFEMRVF